MEDYFKIGRIVKPRGIKGELKVLPLTDDVKRFSSLKSAYIDGTLFKVEKATVSDGVYIKLSGVNDRNAAETFRGKFLLVSRENALPLSENSYYIADLIGAKVYTENGEIGVLEDVISAKTDIFTVRTAKGILRFPFLKDLVIKINVEDGVITLKEKRLNEVGLYEV